MNVDLGRQFQFPPIALTMHMPEMAFGSESSGKVVLLEQSVPWEDRMQKMFEKQKA